LSVSLCVFAPLIGFLHTHPHSPSTSRNVVNLSHDLDIIYVMIKIDRVRFWHIWIWRGRRDGRPTHPAFTSTSRSSSIFFADLISFICIGNVGASDRVDGIPDLEGVATVKFVRQPTFTSKSECRQSFSHDLISSGMYRDWASDRVDGKA
jgi:hypothetical protein